MSIKSRIFLVTAIAIFSLSIFSTVPTVALNTGSYVQQKNDEFIWEVKNSTGISSLFGPRKVGDRLKLVVTAVNTTKIEGTTYQTLYGRFYNNSVVNSTWEPFLYPGEFLIGGYSNMNGSYILSTYFLVPHNESEVTDIINLAFVLYEFNWTSGPNGYDGFAVRWDGNATGDLNALKVELKINQQGVLRNLTTYNGTGSGWDLTFHMELLPRDSSIPGFLIVSVFLTLATVVTIHAIKSKIKRKY